MNYIENIYICLAAPLLIVVLCLRGQGKRSILFVLGGMTACLLSSYISTFLAVVHGMDAMTASIEISPMVEEFMKLFPIVFYILVFEPDRRECPGLLLMIASGFATFENVCYLVSNGADNIISLVIRGFGTGAMHVINGALIGIGLMLLWDRLYIRIAGMFGLLSLAVIFHAVYNLLVSQAGLAAWIGYVIPLTATAGYLRFRSKQRFGPPPGFQQAEDTPPLNLP